MHFYTWKLTYKVSFLPFFVLCCLCGNSKESKLDDGELEISSDDLFNSIKVQKELVAAVLVKEKENRHRNKEKTETDIVYKEPTFYAYDFEPAAKTKEISKEYLHLFNQYQARRKKRSVTNHPRNYESPLNRDDNLEKERKKRDLLDWLLGGLQHEDSEQLVQHEPMPHWPVKIVKRSEQRIDNVHQVRNGRKDSVRQARNEPRDSVREARNEPKDSVRQARNELRDSVRQARNELRDSVRQARHQPSHLNK